jgi:hypothetical protein
LKSEKNEHQKIFLALSLVFAFCSIAGYGFELIKLFMNNIWVYTLNTIVHMLLALFAGLLVSHSGTVRLINVINDFGHITSRKIERLEDELNQYEP